MSTRRPLVLLASSSMLICASSYATPAAAQVFPVDDSASEVLASAPLKMHWDAPVPGPGRPNTIAGEVLVRVRLNTSPWRGRNARIYQILPPQPIGPVEASWTANGPLLPGRLHDGGRTLVYAGPILGDRLEDTFRLTIRADGDRVLRPQDLRFAFEIEPESP